MKKNTFMKWRLSALPTPEQIQGLVASDILSKDEAREILFSTEEDRDSKSLKEEIKFLRDLVEKLSDNKMSRIVEVIKEVPVYRECNWYQPYVAWCGTDTALSGTIPTSAGISCASTTASSFSDIETF